MTKGTIIKFNGQFGFIKSESGDVFFHKTDISTPDPIEIGDEVEFSIKPSEKKPGAYQAYAVSLIKKAEKKEIISASSQIGRIAWFNVDKGFGIIITPEKKEYFLHISNYYSENEYLKIGNVLVFTGVKIRNKLQALNCKFANEQVLSIFYKYQNSFAYQYPQFHLSLWLDDYILEKDLNCIAKHLTTESYSSYSNPFEIIFKKLTKTEEQQTVLNEFVSIIGEIDSEEKYGRIKELIGLSELHENVKNDFLKSAYDKATNEIKYLMWLDDYILEKDLNYIAKHLTTESYSSYSNPFEKIFKKLTKTEEQQTVLNEFVSIIGEIDSEEKYGRIKELIGLAEIKKHIKKDFLNVILIKTDNYRKCLRYLKYWQFKENNDDSRLTELLHQLNARLFYDFCFQLIDPLAIKNTHYYHSGLSFLKIFLTQKEYIQQTNTRYGKSSVFYHHNTLLTQSHFAKKLAAFKTILTYINEHKLEIELKAKNIIDDNSVSNLFSFLSSFRAFNTAQNQICKDLEIEILNNTLDIERYIVERSHITQLLKYWVYDLIEHFDFNSYCYYYFTLTLKERKIFNKKAKAIMGEEIKASMLRKREPWKFVERIIINDISYKDIFNASWKSIWFGDKFIKFCVDKDAVFSSPFKWEFSEEKFNFLYEYISGRRLKEIVITVVDGRIENVEGLEELEEVIWKVSIIKEIESSEGIIIRGIGQNRIPVNIILRNQCIQFLNKLQVNDLFPTRILEKTINIKQGGFGVDVSLLYSIPLNNEEISIIWESLELEKSKATHIFKCIKSEYEKIFSEIEFYLSGNTKVRSALNSNDIDDINKKKELRYLCRIDHDNFNFSKWENSLFEILPELRTKKALND